MPREMATMLEMSQWMCMVLLSESHSVTCDARVISLTLGYAVSPGVGFVGAT